MICIPSTPDTNPLGREIIFRGQYQIRTDVNKCHKLAPNLSANCPMLSLKLLIINHCKIVLSVFDLKLLKIVSDIILLWEGWVTIPLLRIFSPPQSPDLPPSHKRHYRYYCWDRTNYIKIKSFALYQMS